MTFPTYFEAFDAKQMLEEYPVGDAFTARYTAMSRDELHALQNERFQKLMRRGWEIPFYQRLWGAKGIEAADIKSLEDITKLPVYDKTDLMASIADHPPYGDFGGLGGPDRAPTIFHTTSGTTGRPQALLFGPKGREITNLLVRKARSRTIPRMIWRHKRWRVSCRSMTDRTGCRWCRVCLPPIWQQGLPACQQY